MTVLMVFLLAQTPARVLNVVTGPQLTWNGISGTIWRGRVLGMQVQSPWGPWHLGTVDWQLHPWSLLLLSPRLSIESDWQGQQVVSEVTVSAGGRLRFKESQIELPAGLARIWFPVTVGGEVAVLAESLLVENGNLVDGTALVSWNRADWTALDTPLPLGDYEARVVINNGKLDADVMTKSGSVEIAGTANWTPTAYGVDILLRGIDEQLPQILRNALSLVAVQDSEGFRLRFES